MKKKNTIAVIITFVAMLTALFTSGLRAEVDQATALGTLGKISAATTKPATKAAYDRVIAAVTAGGQPTAADLGVLRMGLTFFAGKKPDAVEAIQFVLNRASANPVKTVKPTTANDEEVLRAATVLTKQIDGDPINSEARGPDEKKTLAIRTAIAQAVAATQGDAVTGDPVAHAKVLSVTASITEKALADGKVPEEDKDDAKELAWALRIGATELTKTSAVASTTPAPSPAPALPASVPMPSAATSVPPPATSPNSANPKTEGLPGGDPRPANPGPAISPGPTDVPPRALPKEEPKVEVKGSVALRRRSK